MTVKRRVEWNDQNISTASKLWASGQTVTDLSNYFAVSRSTISGMILRNRSRFEERGAPKSRNSGWTEAQFTKAALLWTQGESYHTIGSALGAYPSSVRHTILKNPDRFPPRERDGRSSAMGRKPLNEFNPMASFVESKASERYDFTQYQIAGTEPVEFWKLENNQCHFPLERFEAVSGPTTPCCGQRNPEGGSYCNTHSRLMREPRVR